jgi:hypothetical protein
MANKVASKRWIYSNFSVGSSSNECATKTEILGFGLYITNDSSYASNQLVREEDIYLPAWTYSFSVSNWDKNVGESGGTTSSISISSSKSRLGTTESVGWSIDSSTVPSWITWNSSSMTFTVASNSSTSSRTANIYFEQDESGKRDYARVTQAEATPPVDTYVFTWFDGSTSDVSASFPWDFSANGTAADIPLVSTKNGSSQSWSVSSEPSWIVTSTTSSKVIINVSDNSGSARSGTIVLTQSGSNKTLRINVTQAEATPPVDTYVFTWFDGSTSDVSASFPWDFSANGTAADIPLVSTKNGSSQSWSVSSEPSWIVTSTTSSKVIINVSDNSGSARSGTIVLTQSGSNKTLRINVTQAGHTQVTTYNYVFWTSTSGGTSTSGSFGQSGSSIQPQIYSYRETIVDGTVTSRDAISFSYTDKPSWITGEAVSTGYNPPNSPTYYAKMTASENTSVDARSYDVVITQSGSDKEITISVSQPGKANEYTFEIRKSDEEYTGKTSITFDVPASTVGWSGNYAYRSRKNGEQFANVSFSSSASWLHVESSGAYTVDHNTGSSSRSGTITLTQAESGLKCYVYINQSGYTPTYTFNVSPTNLSVTAAETNETLTVNSYKTVLESDGSETTESLDYEFSSDASWVNAARTTTNTTYITIAENLTVAKRNAKITLTQAESGAQAFTNVTQAGKVQSDNKLTITSVTYEDAYLFPPGITPVVGSEVYLKVLLPNTFTWKTSSGLAINRGTAYAGDICNIYVFENSRYKLVKSFELKTGTQTVII